MYKITLPNKKRAFIEITVADNDFIVLMGDKTFNEFRNEFRNGVWIQNHDVIKVLDTYIDNGYGNHRIDKYFL